MGLVIETLLLLPLVVAHPGALVPNTSYIWMEDLSSLQRLKDSDFRVQETRDYTPAKVEEAYCLTPGCVKAAAQLINNMNTKVDPCDDFYEFACGNFISETIIPDHKIIEGAFSILQDKLNERLRKLFESEAEAGEPEIYDSVRELYKSCMDQDEIEKSGKAEALDMIKELGGWPVIDGDKFDADKFDWTELSAKADRMKVNIGKIVSVNIGPNSDDSSRRILIIDQPSLGLPREYLMKGMEDKDVKAYYRFMVDTAVYLGADKETAKREMKEALKLELKIAEMTIPKEERRNQTALNNHMTVAEAAKMYPGVNWVNFINHFLNNPDVTIDKSEIVNVVEPSYFKKAAKFFPTVNPRVHANYMMWKSIKSIIAYLDKEALKIQHQFLKVYSGKSQEQPRWEECVESTTDSLNLAVGSMYAKNYFGADKKKVVDEMVVNIRNEFKIMLEELNWMNNATKARAHIKVEKMTSHIAYPKEILDKDLINEFYSGLKLDSSSYLKNILRLDIFLFEYNVKEFRKPIDKQSWKTHGGAAKVNAFYHPAENSIQVPAGILGGVFFQADRPNYLNYGAIGFIIGHEITHGFDDEGSQRDADGNLVEWWEKGTKEKYLNKVQCIIDQYNNFTVDISRETLNLNGINTQGENIADNGGFKEAIRAYTRLTDADGTEPLLPGLPYTQRQLFWLSGASVWCEAMRPEIMKIQVLTDPHSPGRFRVIGPLRNSKEFAKDWKCPVGSPMNPQKKCSVW